MTPEIQLYILLRLMEKIRKKSENSQNKIASFKRRGINRVTTQESVQENRLSCRDPYKQSKSGGKQNNSKQLDVKLGNLKLNNDASFIKNYVSFRAASHQKKQRALIKKIKRIDNISIKMRKTKAEEKQSIQKHKSLNSLVLMQKQLPIQLNFQVKQIFSYLTILRNYGFSQKKVTKWMNNFLCRRSPVIRAMFLKSSINKKSLNNSIVLERRVLIQAVMNRINFEIQKLTESEVLFLFNEIRCFKNYIQDIVIKKTQSNLDQIFNIGDVNPVAKFDKYKYAPCSEVLNLVKDLRTIQNRYGSLQSVSKFNRVFFQQVVEAEEKFMNEFYYKKKQAQED